MRHEWDKTAHACACGWKPDGRSLEHSEAQWARHKHEGSRETSSFTLVNGDDETEMDSQELAVTLFELVTGNETVAFSLVEGAGTTRVVVVTK
jgi:hypothetical protein